MSPHIITLKKHWRAVLQKQMPHIPQIVHLDTHVELMIYIYWSTIYSSLVHSINILLPACMAWAAFCCEDIFLPRLELYPNARLVQLFFESVCQSSSCLKSTIFGHCNFCNIYCTYCSLQPQLLQVQTYHFSFSMNR